ncbi:ATP-binding protein [Candidatus Bipolaricaulota bacterium]|nr:ATP-binding protein [Candidatus Bipolaricaulota bacterium]
MDNPFRYSGVVTGDLFVDREDEIAALHRAFRAGEHVFLYSPRRYGKTSLLHEAFRRLPAGEPWAFVDLSRALSLQSFVELFISAVLHGAESSADRARRWARKFLSRLQPRLVLDNSGRVQVELGFGPRLAEPTTLAEALDLPQRVAEDLGVRLAVALDEFPMVAELGGDGLVRAMRAAFQMHRLVSYVFAGSQTTMMEQLFAAERSPFFRMGRPLRLEKIPRDAFVPFLVGGFRRGGMDLPPDLAGELCRLVDDHPYFVQTLAHELWDQARARRPSVAAGDLTQALASVVGWHDAYYRRLWERLTLYQRRCLLALAELGTGASLFAADTVARFELKSASHVQRALEALQREGLVHRRNGEYGLADPLFPHWARAAGLVSGRAERG